MLHDLRLAFRSLRSWRFGAIAAVLTLAIGIGTATSMFALVRMALTSTIPDVEDLPSLGRIYASSRALGVERSQLTVAALDLLEGTSSFESVGAYTSDDGEMTTGGEPAAIEVGQVSAGFFPAMRAHAATGRLLSPDDFREENAVVVVSDRIWRTHFAGRTLADAVLTIDGRPRTVVGVLPPTFGFSFIGIGSDAWIPIATGPDARERRVSMLARLKPGATWAAAAAEIAALARAQNPGGLWTWSAITADQDISKRVVGGFAMMFGPALVVLLIGCTNVACMLLARGIDRDVELSVRSALGASRWRIARQLIAENLALAFAGGALGSGLAYALLRIVIAGLTRFRPDAGMVGPSGAALLPIALGFSVGACLLFGAWPAIRLSRRDIASSLKGGTAPALARFVGYRARDLIVFVEVGVAVGLVVTIAMFIRFFIELERITPLFPADRIVAIEVLPPEVAAAAERVSGLPAVAAVSVGSDLPDAGRGSSILRSAAGRIVRGSVIGVDRTYLDTLGIPLVRGRSFNAAESGAHTEVAVVSQAAANALWPGEDPIGARVTISDRTNDSAAVVIGVAREAYDAGGLSRHGLIAPHVYVPLDPGSNARVLVIARAAGDARLLIKPVTAAVRTSQRGRAPRVRQIVSGIDAEESAFFMTLFAGFGLLALLLAASGVFGVISQSVAQRTTEFGVRMAMGATAGQVLRMVLVREGKLILAAIGSGAAVTLLVTRYAFVEMLVISGSDPRIWVVVAALCGGTAAAAVTLATWRIVQLDPWKILRAA